MDNWILIFIYLFIYYNILPEKTLNLLSKTAFIVIGESVIVQLSKVVIAPETTHLILAGDAASFSKSANRKLAGKII